MPSAATGADGIDTAGGEVSGGDEVVEGGEVMEMVDRALVVVVDGAVVVVELPPVRFEPPGAGVVPVF